MMDKMKLLPLISLLVLVFTASPVYAHWDDDTWVAHERSIQSDWDSVLELECFIALDDAPIVLVANAKGVVEFNGQCEDFAFQLRDRAWHTLETEIITGYEYNQMFRKSAGYNVSHMMNKAVIGNEVWLVDEGTKKIWLYLYLD